MRRMGLLSGPRSQTDGSNRTCRQGQPLDSVILEADPTVGVRFTRQSIDLSIPW